MKRKELIKKYIEFFKSKGHAEIKNSSLIPENDPTVLFTTAGMHPLVPFLLGQPHPQGKRLVNVQKCIRTGDINEVGDEVHHTFFEMLGNWSLGNYWKEGAIKFTFEFLTQILKIPLEKLAASVFKGDKTSPKDEESYNALIAIGLPKERIAILEKKDNWWGPAGQTGPCGPCSEIFYWISKKPVPKKFDSKNKNWVEIGNNVFMEYNKIPFEQHRTNQEQFYNKKGVLKPHQEVYNIGDTSQKYETKKFHFLELKQKNVDFGGGSERTLAILNDLDDNYLTDCFLPIIKKIEELSKKEYGKNKENTKAMKIIADHIKAAVFILNEGILPSNKEHGYVLRRLIRRAIIYGKRIGLENFTEKIAKPVFEIYSDYNLNKEKIISGLLEEENQFNKTLIRGMNLFEKLTKEKKIIDGKNAFLLFQSYGFPIEMTKELTKEKDIRLDEKGFYEELKKHQELSRTATAGKFKSGLADNSESTTKLHTAAHLLLSALKKVLHDDKIIQKGSNITPERLRLDFSFPRKLTEEEIKDVENLVNEQIKKEMPVIREEMSIEEAKKSGAQGIFEDKYRERVSVYTIENFSKEICTGPHVKNTKELNKFKILKEESSSSGIRRIRANLED